MGRIEQSRQRWTRVLQDIRSTPLEYCPDFPAIAERWTKWWQCEGDRPLLVAATAKHPDVPGGKWLDLIDQPRAWLAAQRQALDNLHCVGDFIPFIRADLGPVAMAAFLGAPLHLAPREQTSWQDPIIDSWDTPPEIAVDPDNEWLQKALALMEVTAQDAAGRYLVCTPDLTGAIDALVNMRTPEKLAMDLYDHRDDVLQAAAHAVDGWEFVFSEMYDRVLGQGAGITQWINCWADGPFTVPTCDFNALIGREDFRDVCMPSLTEQARRAGLCVFHLDGPDAARHAETMARDPDITAIEYVPGAATPSALAKLPMFKMFQEHRVPLFLEVQKEEVQSIIDALDPRGLAVRVHGLDTPGEADALFAWVLRRFQ